MCSAHSSEQSMAMFGIFEEEMSQIFDIVNLPYDEYVYNNKDHFKIDLELKELILKAELFINKYKVL